MMRLKQAGVVTCVLVLLANVVASQGLEGTTELSYTFIYFTESRPNFDSNSGSVAGTLSLGGHLLDRWSINLSVFARNMLHPGSGSILELNEGWIRYDTDQFSLTIGVDVVAWPTLDFFPTTDFINQRDLSSVERHQRKIGQPMIKTGYYAGDILIEGYILPRFTLPIYPSTESRFGDPLPILDGGTFDDRDGRNQPGFAALLEYAGADATIGGFAYHGYQLTPALLTVETSSGTALQQTYSTGASVGAYGNLLWDRADTILKAQVIRSMNFLNRSGVPQDFATWGVGIEKYVPTLSFDGTSTTVFAEYTRDSRGSLSTDPYPDGLALATIVDFHDPASSKLGLSLTQDTNGEDQVWGIEFERRLTDRTTMNVQGQLFHRIDPTGVLADLEGGNLLQMEFTTRF